MRWARASVVQRTSRAAAAFVLRLDALAAEERDRAAAAVAKHGRESLAAQVRRACELVKDGLVERDTEVRSQRCSAKSKVVKCLRPGPAVAARGALRRAPAAHREAWHRKEPARPSAQVRREVPSPFWMLC